MLSKIYLCTIALLIFVYPAYCAQLDYTQFDEPPCSRSPQITTLSPSSSEFSVHFRKVFSQENLDTLNAGQTPDNLSEITQNTAVTIHEAMSPAGEPIVGTISWTKSDDPAIFIKTLAINPGASDKEAQASIHKIMRALQKKHGQKRFESMFSTHANNNLSKAISTPTAMQFLQNEGLQQQQSFINLQRSIDSSIAITCNRQTFNSIKSSLMCLQPEEQTTLQQNAAAVFTHATIIDFLNSTEQQIHKLLRHKQSYTIVMYAKKTPISALVYSIRNAKNQSLHASSMGRIDLLGVLPEYRKKGFASILLQYALIEMARIHHAQTAEIYALESNIKAQNCYLKNGFKAALRFVKMKGSRSNATSPAPAPQPNPNTDMSPLVLPPPTLFCS